MGRRSASPCGMYLCRRQLPACMGSLSANLFVKKTLLYQRRSPSFDMHGCGFQTSPLGLGLVEGKVLGTRDCGVLDMEFAAILTRSD